MPVTAGEPIRRRYGQRLTCQRQERQQQDDGHQDDDPRMATRRFQGRVGGRLEGMAVRMMIETAGVEVRVKVGDMRMTRALLQRIVDMVKVVMEREQQKTHERHDEQPADCVPDGGGAEKSWRHRQRRRGFGR